MDLYFEEQGKGNPMIFLHGNGEDLHIFDEYYGYFSGKYKVIGIDSRGHGKSKDAKMAIPLMANDIVEFIEKKGLSDIILIGFSDGGNIALEVASTIPLKINHLILVGANLYPGGMKLGILFGCYLATLFSAFCSFIEKYRKKNRYYRIMTCQPKITDEKVKRITAKTLVIAGKNDMIKHKHTLKIHKLIKGSYLAIIKDGDHFLFANKKDEMKQLITDFITSKNFGNKTKEELL